MASFNKITIVGHLGRDPEIKYTGQGNAVCNFTMATSEKRKDASGDMQETTTWFRVTVWGKQAELCNQYLAKGRQAYIEGRVSLQEYTDRDGNKRSSLEVNASDVRFLGGKGENGEAEAPQGMAKAAAHEYQKNPTKAQATVGVPDDDDNGIPF